MRFILMLPLMLVLLCGCSLDDALRQTEVALAAAEKSKAEAVIALEKAQETAKGLQILAESLDAEKAAAVLRQADDLIERAKTNVSKIDDALVIASEAHKAAQAARDGGGNLFEILLAAGGALIPGLAIYVKGLNNARTYRAAIRAAANHADRMERAETDDDVRRAKELSIAEQESLRVRSLLEDVRR